MKNNPYAPPKSAQLSERENRDESFHGRYWVLAFFCACAGVAYIQRAAMSVPATEIATDLGFSDLARDMGWVQSAWYFGYAMMQLPSGWFADRVGSRQGVAILCVIWSSMTLASGFATGFISLVCLWGLMGATQAGAFPCAAKAIGQIFPDTERARASGLLASGMAIGAAIAPGLAGLLLEALRPISGAASVERWRILLALYSIPGFLWSMAFLSAVNSNLLPKVEERTGQKAPVDWQRLFQSASLGLLCAQQFFRAAAMVFFVTWFPTFLQKVRGVTSLESGILTTVAGVGVVLGSLSGGVASDWLLRATGNPRLSRQGIAVLGMSICAALILGSYFIADVKLSISVIALGGFCAAFGGVSGYTVAISFGGKHVATVFSSMNMFGNFGAALFPATAGWLVARTGNWNLILFLFAGIMAIDAICWALLNPKGTLFGEDSQSR